MKLLSENIGENLGQWFWKCFSGYDLKNIGCKGEIDKWITSH
jgi:hypothetical protein